MSDNIGSPQVSYVWLNGSLSEPLESTTIRGEAEKINRQYRFCSNSSDCETYLKAQSSNGHIVLIISGSLGKELVPKIHDLPQIIRIHVYCYDKSLHEPWARNFAKVKGVFIEFNELLRSLSLNSSSADTDSSSNDRVTEASSTDVPVETDSTTVTIPEINQTTPDASLITPQESVLPKDEPTPAPPTEIDTNASPAPEQTASPFLYEPNTAYHTTTACSDLITRMPLRPEEISDYISLCRDASSGNEQLLAAVEEFCKNYSRDKAITYLYSDTFSWPYLDNIFKAGYIDGIYSSRVLIRDIEKQLEQHKCATVTRVYLCELMFNEDFQRLQTFNGRVIAMKYFLWTNTDREKAISIVSHDASNSECKRLLFEIEADPQTANVKPFAKLDSVSTINDPEQVLVMIGSLLRITAIEDEKDGIINIKAQLCGNDDDNEIAKQINQIKQEYIGSNGETDTVKFGQFQITLGNTFGDTNLCNSGEKLIRDYHNKLQIDSLDHTKCCCALGNLEFTKGEYDSSLANYKKAFDLKINSSTVNDLELAAIHNALGSVYNELNQHDQALDHYQKAVQIWRTFNYDFHSTLVSCYTNMGHIHMQSDRYTDAFYYYSQAEIILIKNNDTNSFIYALCCHNLGTVRNSLQQYHLALGHFETSLEIKSTFLEPLNPSIASTYRCIGTVYKSMDCISQARDMFERALEIYRQVPSPDDATISEVEQMIRELPNESA